MFDCCFHPYWSWVPEECHFLFENFGALKSGSDPRCKPFSFVSKQAWFED